MMETIRVNMTPCEDIKTIHASQNDNEAREWGFELHNNGEVIDSGGITDQIVFKAYKGGTEEILPTNGSVPVTAPFLGDIRYPQGLLSDQEFLYRESPAEKDGNAKIKSLYGNTLVWNQLVPPLSAMQGQNGTISVADNVATITSSSSASYLGMATSGSSIALPKGGHKYLLTCEVKSSKAVSSCQLSYGNSIIAKKYNISANTWTKLSSIVSYSSPTGKYVQCRVFGSFEQGDTMQVRNWNYFDLTVMGLDSITSVDEFTSLFPLSYYSYNQGSLLSFNGNGIKTVSKNQFDTQVVTTSYDGLTLTKTQGTIRAVYSGGSQYAGFNFYGSPVFTDTFLKGKYRLSFDVSGLDTQWTVGLRRGASFLGGGQALAISNDGHYSFTIDAEANPNCYLSFARTGNKTTAYDVTFSNIQLELGTTETSYTPFEEKTISLPISQYFPTGMKDVPDYTNGGKIYDEMTSNKADTRVGNVDLGTLDWSLSSPSTHIFRGKLTDTNAKIPNASNLPNALLANYQPKAYNPISANDNGYFAIGYRSYDDVDVIVIIDSNYSTQDSFISHISGQYLYYELATPTETSFTTASLVTENTEIPLSNDDGVLIGKCTEELSAQPGFFDAKIKLTDGDGTCYSNKIQLHVERKPS